MAEIMKSLPPFLFSLLPGCGEEGNGNNPLNNPSDREKYANMPLEDPNKLLRDFFERAIEIIEGGTRVMQPHDSLIVRVGTPGTESLLCKWPQEQSGPPRSQGTPEGLNGFCAIIEQEGGKITRIGRIGLGEDAGIWGLTTATMIPRGRRIFVGWTYPGETGELGQEYWIDIALEAFMKPFEDDREGYCDIMRWNDFDPYVVSRPFPEFDEAPEKTLRRCYHWEQSAFGYIDEIIAQAQKKPVDRCVVCKQEPCASTQTTKMEDCNSTNPPYYFSK